MRERLRDQGHLSFRCAAERSTLIIPACRVARVADPVHFQPDPDSTGTQQKSIQLNFFHINQISEKMENITFKGTVSRELRHRLLYIIQKLFSRPIVALLKILILLRGQFAMYINSSA